MSSSASPSASAPPPVRPQRFARLSRFFARYGRWLLLVLGVLAAVLLVQQAGAAEVGVLLLRAAPWLPFIIVCEIAFAGFDACAVAYLLRKEGRAIPLSAWIRSTAYAYGFSIVLPAGRAAGEVGRAATLAPYVGAATATAASAQLHGLTLTSNGINALVAALWLLPSHGLGSTVEKWFFANALLLTLLGVGVLALARSASLRRFLERRFSPTVAQQPALASQEQRRADLGLLLGAFALTLLARTAQTVEYGAIVQATGGGAFTVHSSLASQGVHLLGATVGDFVPNQMGAVEGMYRLCAPLLGFADTPARALALPLVARCAQLLLAVGCLIGTAFSRKAAHVAPTSPGDRAQPSALSAASTADDRVAPLTGSDGDGTS